MSQQGTALICTLSNVYHFQQPLARLMKCVQPGLPGLVGQLESTAAVRANIDDSPTFRTLLRRLSTRTAQSISHSQHPISRLLEQLKLNDVSQLEQTAFTFEGTNQAVNMAGTSQDRAVAFGEIGSMLQLGSAEFELTSTWDYRLGGRVMNLAIVQDTTERSLSGKIEFDDSMLEKSTVGFVASHFNRLIDSVVSNCNLEVNGLSLLWPHEEKKLLQEQSKQ